MSYTDQENCSENAENSLPHMASVNALRKTSAALSSSKLSNQAPKITHDASYASENPMEKLMQKLSEQSNKLNQQREALAQTDEDAMYSRTIEYITSTSSVPITPATDVFDTTNPPTGKTTPAVGETPKQGKEELSELAKIKAELELANSKLARLEREKEQDVQARITRQTLDNVLGNASEADYPMNDRPEFHDVHMGHMQNNLNLAARPQFAGRDKSYMSQDDNRSDTSEPLSASGFARNRAIWGNTNRQQPNVPGFGPMPPGDYGPHTTFAPIYGRPGYAQQHSEPGASSPGPLYSNYPPRNNMVADDLMLAPPRQTRGASRFNGRNGPMQFSSSTSSYDGFQPPYGSVAGLGGGIVTSSSGPPSLSSSMYPNTMGYSQPAPLGSPLSPHAPEFNSDTGLYNDPPGTEIQTYVSTTEPINYRRLLDRTVSCNWKYIVDKIVCSNDQQASIFLQQKLKVGTPEQKYEIVEAIVAQAYALMINRFGNFLVQRCFEHGVPEQVIKIAEAIRGNTLNLSMDAFGCHVVQKAFDSVPEDYKAIMVHELLRRIPETVIHRYACHVWQKLFELRWAESPPQIMKYVNEALAGMWHEVALGETGSLVVQNIFENCLEDDKRPCIEEVLASIDIVAHGQFGNWCIQHICEHGAPADRSRAVDHVIRYASEYSRDQFASKVVEKCLKIGGVDFLTRYLDRVCAGSHDRPRIPLIDIASDQYGNYLIQYILTHANPQHREIVASHIRKHMVSLRGSKFGSRVGMLCTNPAFATRPGPGVGPGVGPVIGGGRGMPQQNPRYGGAYR